MRFFAIILLACVLLFSATPALAATTFPYEPLEPTFFGQNVQISHQKLRKPGHPKDFYCTVKHSRWFVQALSSQSKSQ